MTALVIAEHDHGALKSATLHTIAAAQKLGGDIHVLVAGYNAGGAAQAAASIAGVAKVLHADAAHLPDAVGREVGERLGAVACLEQEGAAGRHLRQRLGEVPGFSGEYQRGQAG